MSAVWLRTLGQPPRQFYRDVSALPLLVPQDARHQLLQSAGTLRSDIDGETPSVTVTLRNDAGQCARLFLLPPIGESAEIRDASGVLFAGSIRSIDMGGTDCRLEIQA